jgi:hypothetical protein
LGIQAGVNARTGNYNTYVGNLAAIADTSGNNNTIIGSRAGYAGRNYTAVTILGDSANVNTANAVNAGAIGHHALAECDSCLVLGSVAGKNNAIGNVNVGVGTTNPQARLDVGGNVKLGAVGTAINALIKHTANINIPSLAANVGTTIDVPVANATSGAVVRVTIDADVNDVVVANARVSANGTVRIRLVNAGTSSFSATSVTVQIAVIQ